MMSGKPLPQPPSWSLAGKTSLVIGASSGIGRAAAVALARAQSHVFLAARNKTALSELSDQLAECDCTTTVLPLDATDFEYMRKAFAEHGPFDVLVNSAGINPAAPALDLSTETFDEVMLLNVKVAFFAAAECARGLIAAGKPGSIINISSQMGRVSGPNRSLYSASKSAVDGFTRGMALEWGEHGIRVNALAPTFIRTPLTEKFLADPVFMQSVIDKIALGRIGSVEDLMGAIVFLASDASALITGSSLLADGGWTAA